MNYFPFHVGDYVSATRHLSWEEDAAYRRLLDTYYTTEKPLPADLRAVCRLVLAQTDSQREAVRQVLEEFFELTEEGWRNRRADAEIEAMVEKQEKQRAKAQARWNKQRTEHGNATAMPRHGESDAAASKSDADAMPPTPTPTPKEEREESIAKGGAGGKVQPRGARLPTDWAPDPKACEDALEAGLHSERIPLEAAKFRDYWRAQPGQKGVKADWPATWRNWCRKAAEHVPRGATGPPIWRERQLETAALMTGATRAAPKTQQDALDVESRIIPSSALG